MFSVVNVYFNHLKFCVVCINSRRYVCCSECNVVYNECNEHTGYRSPYVVSAVNVMHVLLFVLHVCVL